MGYKGRHLVAFVAGAVGLTAGGLWTTANLIEPLLDNPVPLHEFLFNRSPVQWCTIAVFFFALLVLGHRLVRHRAIAAGTRRLAAGRAAARRGAVAARVETLSAHRRAHGREAAVRLSRELCAADHEELMRTYGLLSAAVQLMLALGLFGTLYGINRTLFGSSGLGVGADPAVVRSWLDQFTVALSTALNTSVLGLACSLVATIVSTGIHWLETNQVDMLTRVVEREVGLDSVEDGRERDPEERDRGSDGAEIAKVLASLQTPIEQMVETVARQTREAMVALTTSAAETQEALLRDALAKHQQAFETHQGRSTEQLAASHAQTAALALEAFEAQSRALTEAVAGELHDIAAQLGRVPEVSIRYASVNGTPANGSATYVAAPR